MWPKLVETMDPPAAFDAVKCACWESVGFIFACRCQFGRLAHGQQPSDLPEDWCDPGIRHPLYTSVIAVAVGWALVWQSWPALVVAAALIPFFGAKARREERWLREIFPEYAEYEKRVPRFLSRVC